MVLLGKGKDGGSSGLSDLHIEERLHRYMVGGKEAEEKAGGKEKEGGGKKGGGGEKGNGEYRCGHGFDTTKCSRIQEGAAVNTDVTAPGATLALGLMFIRSEKAGG